MSFCPQCGAAISPGASFCSACGATLALGPAADRPGIAPPPVAEAAPRVRPVGVTIVGVVTLVGAGFALLGGLFLLLFFGVLGAAFGERGLGGFFGALGAFITLFIFAFAAVGLLVGFGILRGKEWAWSVTLVLLGLNILGGISAIAQRQYGGLFSIVVCGLVVWYFFQPDVKRWFHRPA